MSNRNTLENKKTRREDREERKLAFLTQNNERRERIAAMIERLEKGEIPE